MPPPPRAGCPGRGRGQSEQWVSGAPQVHCSIPVAQMRAVERVDEGTFQHPHVMQIVAQGEAGQLHTTYIQCKVGAQPSATPHHSLGSLQTFHPLPVGIVPVPYAGVARHWLHWQCWGAQSRLYDSQRGILALPALAYQPW